MTELHANPKNKKLIGRFMTQENVPKLKLGGQDLRKSDYKHSDESKVVVPPSKDSPERNLNALSP